MLLGNGNGTFQAAKTSSASVAAMVTADFNKDGRLDLAVVDGSSSLSILLGNGDGTFSLTSTYPTEPGNLYAVASADFNQDGNSDVALPNGQVFLGNGNGTFRVPGTFETSPGASFIAAVDMNGDGIPDLVTAHSAGFGPADFEATGVSLGNGDGTFHSVRVFDSGGTNVPFPVFLATGDLNGDGLPDVVIAAGSERYCCGSATPQLSILLNRGNGTFPAAELDISGGSGGIAVGDFNRDGNLDLAMADGSVYLGTGDGALRFIASATLGGVAVVTGDFNHDGKPDLAAADECLPAGCAYGGQLVISLGNGDGTFQPVTSLPSGGFNAVSFYYAESLVTADFNHDGNPDIAILNNCVDVGCSSPGGSVSTFFGKKDGTFSSGNTVVLSQQPFGGHPLTIVAGDFNNDGNVDLAAIGSTGLFEPVIVTVLLGNRDGTFQSPIVFQAASPGPEGGFAQGAVTGDFNQDGILDLAIASSGSCSDCDSFGGVMYGKGDGTFAAGPDIGEVGGPLVSIVAADFYGSGNLTAVFAKGCASPGDCPAGSLQFPGTHTPDVTDMMLLYLAVGDFNNDGKPDLAGSLQFDAGASVLLNIGATLAATTTTISPSALRTGSAFHTDHFHCAD